MRKANFSVMLPVMFGLFAFAMFLAAPATVRAQYLPPKPIPQRDPSRSLGDHTPNNSMESLLKSTSSKREWDWERRRNADQLNEAFDRLWQLKTQVIVPMSSAALPDYKKLSEAAAEIKEHATLIKHNSALPNKDKATKVVYQTDVNQLPSMLRELNRLIVRFRLNPVFFGITLNDAEMRSAAGRDLEGIIKLSGTINKLAKKLSPNK